MYTAEWFNMTLGKLHRVASSGRDPSTLHQLSCSTLSQTCAPTTSEDPGCQSSFLSSTAHRDLRVTLPAWISCSKRSTVTKEEQHVASVTKTGWCLASRAC